MTGPADSKLTRKQQAAAIALVAESTIEAAAQACGVGERTLYRWMKVEAFNQEVARLQRETFGRAMLRLQRIAEAKADRIAEIIDDTKAPATARVAAYRTAVEFGLRWIEVDDLQKRLDGLERLASERKGQR